MLVFKQAIDRSYGAERLRRAEKAEVVGNLAGGLAHDFNNLLGIILGNLDRIRRLLPADAAAAPCVADAKTATDLAVALVHRLMAFVRNQPLLPQLIAVDHLLVGLKPLIQVAAPGCVVVLDLACAWQSLVDANQFENAVLNLVTNARDAMPGGGRLTILTWTATVRIDEDDPRCAPSDYVVVEVRDTGLGMSAEVQARMFEPFFTTKEAGRGTGLGLSQVIGLATQCGGGLRVASEIGEGTTFTLYIPRATPPEAA